MNKMTNEEKKNYKLVLFNDGKITVEAEGTEKEILKFWEDNKSDYIFWLNDSDWEDENGINQDKESFEQAMTATPQSAEELQRIFDNELDYSWWKMDVVEEDEDNYKEGITLYYMESDSSYYALLVDDNESEPLKLMDYAGILAIRNSTCNYKKDNVFLFDYILQNRTAFDWEEYTRELLPEFMKDKIILKIEG